jgi:PAS domain S-box-containing protein
MVNKRIKSSNDIKNIIENVLKNKSNDKDFSNKSIEQLVEELSIYHRELEYQNDELRRIQVLLEKTKEHFKDLYMNAPIGYVTCKDNLIINSVNNKLTKILAISEHDIIGKSIHKIIHPDYQDTFYFHTRKLLGTGKASSCEVKLLNRENTFVLLDSNLYYIDEELYIRIAVTDISYQKQVEKSLYEHKSMLSSIVNTLPGHLNVIDKDFNVIAVNDGSVNCGYRGDNPSSNKIKCYNKFKNSTRPCHECRVKEIFQSGESIVETISYYDKLEDDQKTMQLFFSPLKGEDGKINGIVEYGIDVTELKNIQRKAQEASIAKSEFIANMSHEIRTPLNGVIGFADLLKTTNLSYEQKQFIKNINVSANSLLTVVNDILDFSKIEAGRLEIELILTNINDILSEVMNIVEFHAYNNDIELVLNVSPQVPSMLLLDPVRVRQILLNLTGNAIKFTKKGLVELIVDFQKSDCQNVGIVTFTVKDNGIGISKENVKKLFKAFSQGDTSMTRKYGGTGLGLIISNKLAEKMASKIELKSQEGLGSEFSFSIETEYISDKNLEVKFSNISRVLTIVKNSSQRKVINAILKEYNVKFDTCKSPIEAISLIQKKSDINLIILDYQFYPSSFNKFLSFLNKNKSEEFVKQKIIILYRTFDSIAVNNLISSSNIELKLIKPIRKEHIYDLLEATNLQQSSSYHPHELNKQVDKISPLINKKLTFLVVDDVDINSKLVKIMLKKLSPNASVIIVKNGQEAIDVYKTINADIIFMDLQMPICDGYQASKEIRNLESHSQKHTPIIALTACVVKGEKEKCLANGMDGYLPKPLKKEDLFKILNQFLIDTN